MCDENGQLFYPTNSEMPSSNDQRHGSTSINHELDIFYDTSIVCGFSKCKGLNKNLGHVTLSHYINDWLPIVYGKIPPNAVDNPIRGIEKAHRNTYLCSFFDNLEAISTKFHPKLTNQSFSVESAQSSSEPKYDISTMPQKNCTRRSKTLYELREKMSKYTP